jgi:hypothetical protein
MDQKKQLPNSLMYFILTELEELLGKNGINTVLKYKGLDRLVGNYPPADYNPGEPVETFSTIFTSIIEIFGEKGFKSVIRGAGKRSFLQMMETFPGLFGIGELDLDELEPVERFKLVLKTYIENVTQMFGTSTSIEIQDDKIIENMPDCPWCVGVKAESAICIIEADFVAGMAAWSGVTSINIKETLCMARGDETCQLEITFDE